jgi:hypothetical protein
MNRFILLGGILIAAWFVFMATFPFPYGSWYAFFSPCESLRFYYSPYLDCPSAYLTSFRLTVIGVSALLVGFASWSFWKGTRD